MPKESHESQSYAVEFTQLEKDYSRLGIDISLDCEEYYYRLSPAEKEICFETESELLRVFVFSYRLALKAEKIYGISKCDAYCTIRKADNSGRKESFMERKKKNVVDFLALLFSETVFNTNQVEHPLAHFG